MIISGFGVNELFVFIEDLDSGKILTGIQPDAKFLGGKQYFAYCEFTILHLQTLPPLRQLSLPRLLLQGMRNELQKRGLLKRRWPELERYLNI